MNAGRGEQLVVIKLTQKVRTKVDVGKYVQ